MKKSGNTNDGLLNIIQSLSNRVLFIGLVLYLAVRNGLSGGGGSGGGCFIGTLIDLNSK